MIWRTQRQRVGTREITDILSFMTRIVKQSHKINPSYISFIHFLLNVGLFFPSALWLLTFYVFLLFHRSGLWTPERAVLQVRVERESAGASQGHSALWLAHVYNPWLLWPVKYPLSPFLPCALFLNAVIIITVYLNSKAQQLSCTSWKRISSPLISQHHLLNRARPLSKHVN